MTILSHVCVDFFDKERNLLFSVPSSLINCVLTAPEEIQQDPIFDLLLADHSLEAVRTVEQKKQLENDPTAGVTAEGRKTKSTRKDTGKENGKDAGKSGTAVSSGSETGSSYAVGDDSTSAGKAD